MTAALRWALLSGTPGAVITDGPIEVRIWPPGKVPGHERLVDGEWVPVIRAEWSLSWDDLSHVDEGDDQTHACWGCGDFACATTFEEALDVGLARYTGDRVAVEAALRNYVEAMEALR